MDTARKISFQQSRQRAESRLCQLKAPSAAEENYRFSPRILFDWNLVKSEKLEAKKNVHRDEGETALLALWGETSSLSGDAHGCIFESLLNVNEIKEDCLELEAHFAEDKLAQLALAKWQNGVFLKVPKGKKLELPLRALQSMDGIQGIFRTVIELEEGASAHFIDEFSGDAESVIGILEVRVGKNAKFQYTQAECFTQNTQFFIRQMITLESGASMEYIPIYLGAASGQLRSVAKMAGSSSSLEVSGAARVSGKQHFDFWFDMEHSFPSTKSALDFWFVGDEQGRTVFNGLIKIGKNAKHTDAYQKCKTLLLSDKAQVNAIPKLIIQTDEVKCAHGASIASIQPEQIHYLQSRGIRAEEARRMIVRGFTEPVLEKLPTKALYERLDALIHEKEKL